VRSIFFMQGIWIGAIGTFGGLGLGLTACWALATFDLISFPAGVFPLTTRLPMRVELSDLLIITAASFAICMLVTLYPATRAARIKPVDNLRYE
jgi:lipoprotein-releasing system permease protein